MKQIYNIVSQLEIGDRIIVPKSAINLVQHHAIFLGFQNGHYWFIENKVGYGVRQVTAEVFFLGVERITRIERFQPRRNYSREDLRKYALSKLGRSYHIAQYNCESFANDVQNLRVESKQANNGMGLLFLAGLLVVGNAISKSK